MRKYLFVLTILILAGLPIEIMAQKAGIYLAFAKDKNENETLLSTPEKYLSPRAVFRKNQRRIAIDSRDLPVSNIYKNQLISAGIKLISTSKWINAFCVEITNDQEWNALQGLDFISHIKRLGSAPDISHLSPVNKWTCEEEQYAKYSLNTLDYGAAFNQIDMIGADDLHVYGHRAEDMVIGIFDAGFLAAPDMRCFDALYENNRILGTFDIVEGDSDVYDHHYHGTSVWSCIAGILNNDSIVYKGTGFDATFYLFRTEDAATETPLEMMNWMVAAEKADSLGVDIINSSLGYSEFDDSLDNFTYADMNGDNALITIAADIAASKGILVVSSAGNAGNDAWHYITAPADADSVLTVGAVDSLRQYASFSSQGPSFDGRVKPDVATRGKKAIVCASDNGIYGSNGTSFSSPIMAGAAACLWGAFPEKTNMEILYAIQQSASQYNAPDDELGYGIPDMGKAYKILSGDSLYRFDEDLRVSFFPNPFYNELSVFYFTDRETTFDILLTDLSGRVLYSATVDEDTYRYFQLPVSVTQNIHPGMYLLQFQSPRFQKSYKLMKAR